MQNLIKTTFVLSALSLSVATAAHASDNVSMLVKLKDSAMASHVEQFMQVNKMNKRKVTSRQISKVKDNALMSFAQMNRISINHVYSNVYNGFAASLSPKQIRQLKNHPDVDSVVPDEILYISGGAKRNKAVDWPQVIPQGPTDSGSIDSSYTGKTQHVYILDTGVDVNQKDIKANLGLSYAPVFCKNPADRSMCPMPFSDDNLHGTHVAGTVAALNNKINVVGVAPEATIHAVKVCSGGGSCPTSAILAGLNWAVFDMLGTGSPAVANLSLGGSTTAHPGTCTQDGYTNGDEDNPNPIAESYCDAARQGMVIVVAAGNDNSDAKDFSPAHLDSTITVSSYSQYDEYNNAATFSWFSNYGEGEGPANSGVISIAAPGTSVLSLNRTHATMPLSGTSMASPAVAGAAALILQKHPQDMNLSAMHNVRKMLIDNAIMPTSYTTEDHARTGEKQDFPHTEGILNVRFLEDDSE